MFSTCGIRVKFSSLFFGPPFRARHYKRTFVASPDDESSRPTRELIEFALKAIEKTLDVDISPVCQRLSDAGWDPDFWPGEHYRLLAGIVSHLKPRLVIEIGTDKGLSALCLRSQLPTEGEVVTFDLIPWQEIPNTCLSREDFADGRLRQELADLSIPSVFQKYALLLSKADFLFVDGPKDGKFEWAFASLLNDLNFDKPPYVLFDDLRDRNMLRFWREIPWSKLDITSFGHWTGTGLVSWGNRSSEAAKPTPK